MTLWVVSGPLDVGTKRQILTTSGGPMPNDFGVFRALCWRLVKLVDALKLVSDERGTRMLGTRAT
jgi:hypothetical protein